MQNKYNNAVIKNINKHVFFLLYLRISTLINIFNHLFYLLFLNKNTKQNIAQNHLELPTENNHNILTIINVLQKD